MSATGAVGTARPLLDVEGLCVSYGEAAAARRVGFRIRRGRAVGLIGESGSGKTTVAKAILRLLPRGTRVSGSVRLDGTELLCLEPEAMRRLRWSRLAFVPQSAMNALDPVQTVGRQIAEAIRAHRRVSAAAAWARSAELLRRVNVPEARLREFPHRLSGGTRQRVCLAMAMALEPDLLILDEPTTALDVVVQRGILREITELRATTGAAVLLVTHDLAVVAETCDDVVVMYGGRVVEAGPVDEVFACPTHPYLLGLLHAYPHLEGPRQIITIPGQPARGAADDDQCAFAPRCPFAADRCRAASPEPAEVAPGHTAACHFVDRAAEFRAAAGRRETWLPPG